MSSEKAMLVLLRQKKNYLFTLLSLTKEKLTSAGDLEADAENYIELVDAREDIFQKLKELEDEIIQAGQELPQEKSELFAAREPVFKSEIKEMAESIAALEQDFKERAPKILAYIQKKMKTLSNQKRLSNMYERTLPADSGGFYLDQNN